MLRWAIIIALIAGGFGFTGVAGTSAGIAQFLFILFLTVTAIFLILGLTAARKISGGK